MKLLVNAIKLSSEGQKNVVLHLRERASALLLKILPGVMKVKGSTVVNQPSLSIPHKHIRIAVCSIYIG